MLYHRNVKIHHNYKAMAHLETLKLGNYFGSIYTLEAMAVIRCSKVSPILIFFVYDFCILSKYFQRKYSHMRRSPPYPFVCVFVCVLFQIYRLEFCTDENPVWFFYSQLIGKWKQYIIISLMLRSRDDEY